SGTQPEPGRKKSALVFAGLWILFMAVVPMRMIFWNGRPLTTMSLEDRQPWSWAMFLMRTEPEKLDISYEDRAGQWHQITARPPSRLATAKSDTELYALRDYLLRLYPDAKEIKVDLLLKVNERRHQHKTLNTVVTTSGAQTNLEVENLP
ncbi:MAG: hypothetical protein ACRD3W_14270, partial [Terriglobales bacterium]